VAACPVPGANDGIRLDVICTGGRGSSHIRDLTKLCGLNISTQPRCDVLGAEPRVGRRLFSGFAFIRAIEHIDTC